MPDADDADEYEYLRRMLRVEQTREAAGAAAGKPRDASGPEVPGPRPAPRPAAAPRRPGRRAAKPKPRRQP